MPVAVSFTQLVLAAVLAVAAVGKLADLSATRDATEAFGVPAGLAPAVGVLVPLVELAIAAALLPAATGRWGALAAVALLLVFCAAVIAAIRRGAAPVCNCFGGLSEVEVGRGTLVRNSVLVLLAAFVAFAGARVGAFAWVVAPAPGDRLAIAALTLAVCGLACFCWQLLRQNGRLLLRLEAVDATGPQRDGAAAPAELAAGMAAPSFSGRDLDGGAVSLRSLLAPGLPVGLLFTDAGCGACDLVLDAVASAQRDRSESLTLAVLSGGSIGRIEDKAAEFGLDRVVPQDGESLFDAYGVNGFPALVLVDAAGRVVAPAVLGADDVRAAVIASQSPADLVGLAAG
ncbi:MAG: MauE/DoxX family redox-associated membrane protein [Solirubrobacterales bacterium]